MKNIRYVSGSQAGQIMNIETILKSACGPRNQHLAEKPVKKKSKYGNSKKEVDGIIFDSEREAKRYGQLKLLLKTGRIGFLQLQVPYELNEGGEFSFRYIADFEYIDAATGLKITEDCKGFRTEIYKKKKKLMKKVYGIKILET